jgi:hypothetical protein
MSGSTKKTNPPAGSDGGHSIAGGPTHGRPHPRHCRRLQRRRTLPLQVRAGDQLASFETLAGDAQRRQAWAAEEEAHSYAVAMTRRYMCSDLDSLRASLTDIAK